MNSKAQFLTIEEKRAWLARIFRDTSGEYTDADKLKVLEADTRILSLVPQNHEHTPQNSIKNTEIPDNSPETPHQTRSKEKLDTCRTCGNCLWLVLCGYSQHGKQYGWCDARREYRYTTQKCKRYKKYDQSTES